MTWARFDDRYDDHPKLKRAWHTDRAATGLHAMAITHCARHETDGLIDDLWLNERLPNKQERTRVLQVLIDTGLFEREPDGTIRVHDYLDYNPSRASLEEKRQKDRNRKRRPDNNGPTATPATPKPPRPAPASGTTTPETDPAIVAAHATLLDAGLDIPISQVARLADQHPNANLLERVSACADWARGQTIKNPVAALKTFLSGPAPQHRDTSQNVVRLPGATRDRDFSRFADNPSTGGAA